MEPVNLTPPAIEIVVASPAAKATVLTPTVLRREFRCGSMNLPDPGRGFSPEEVKEFYEDSHPFLATYAIEEPKIVNDMMIYEFVKAVGTKG